MLKIVSTIGSGAYARVYKVSKGEEFYAMKLFSGREELSCPWELEILSRHIPNVLYSIEKFKYNEGLAVLLPLAKYDLRKYLFSCRDNLPSIISQIYTGIINLHNAGFYHLDIKPENILIFEDSAKIADFSISRPIFLEKTNSDFTTLNFRPPELFYPPLEFELSEKIDSWSFGILLLEIFTRYRCRGSKQEIYGKIINDFSTEKKELTLKNVPEEYKEFVSGLLELQPEKRLSLRDYFSSRINTPSRQIVFYTSSDTSEFYEKIHYIVKRCSGFWRTCLSAITLLTLYKEQTKAISIETIICAVKIAFQLEEDRYYEYSFLSIFGGKKENLIKFERHFLLTLPVLCPPFLRTPYPHLLEEEIAKKINGSS